MAKYKVRSGMEITIRKAALVQPNDEITRLGSGTVFEAETVGTPTSNTHWVRVTKCDTNPKAVGYFGAVMYPNSLGLGKVFADVIEETPPSPPPPTPMFPESFILTDPSGAQAEYVFVRVIE